MDHDRAKELFTEYHDGDLGEDERRELESHLAGCEECAGEWEAYRMAVGEISGLHKLMASEGFTREVEQKIKKRSRGRFFGEQKTYSTQFAVVSFILIILFIMAYLLLTSIREITVLEDPDAGVLEEPTAEEIGGAGR